MGKESGKFDVMCDSICAILLADVLISSLSILFTGLVLISKLTKNATLALDCKKDIPAIGGVTLKARRNLRGSRALQRDRRFARHIHLMFPIQRMEEGPR